MPYHVYQRNAFPNFFLMSSFNKREAVSCWVTWLKNEVMKARRVVALDTAVGGGFWGFVFIMIK